MLKPTRYLGAVTLFMLISPSSSFGCEPIVPLVQLFGPPLLLTKSLLFLGLAVLLKLIAFVYFERSISWYKAVSFMLIANILSSVIGVLAAWPVATPAAFLIGIPLVYGISLLPAKQLTQRFKLETRARFNHRVIACFITVLYLTSVGLWGGAEGAFKTENLGEYWVLKLAYIYIALIISMGLTIFYEEWVVSKLTKRGQEVTPFLVSVTRANLVTMLFIMSVAAVMILPRRMGTEVIGFLGF